ncbi:MAG: hypothetical protein E7256_15885 [Lachnospiraceae bacterium]|nr:hypothetical protein [Lachnospiraceae bacterium]
MINKKVINEINRGHNLEANLPIAMNELASTYQAYAGTQFVMHYFNVYESIADGDAAFDEESIAMLKEMNMIVKDTILSPFDAVKREKAISKIAAFRSQIIRKMKVLTYYTDVFSLYEYVLNRLELNYADGVQDIDSEEAASEVLNYIFADKDNVGINERIKEMLSQLPVRMTKNKFYDLLTDSLSIYEGAEKESVQDYLYMIRSSAGLYKPEGLETEFEELQGIKKEFEQTDYRDLEEDKFHALNARLREAIGIITKGTDSYYAIQEVINSLYAVILNMPYASEKSLKEMYALEDIIQAIVANIEEDNFENIPDELVDLFMKTEGKLEQFSDNIVSGEAVLDAVKESFMKDVEALMLQPLFECLTLSSTLLSSSLFVEQRKKMEGNADKAYLLEVGNSLIAEFQEALESQSKYLNRAMIAATLKELPVFFMNSEEVTNYVRNAIAGCRDVAEKVASVNLMKDFM